MGGGILRATVKEEIFQGKVTKCTYCQKKILNGEKIIFCIHSKTNVTLARFCSHDCRQEKEFKVLNENGFYSKGEMTRPQDTWG